MKCANHPTSDATAICCHCGRALCPACQSTAESRRVTCSSQCAAALDLTDQFTAQMRTKTKSSLRLTGFLMFGFALVFAVFAFVPMRGRINWYISSLLLLCAVVFLAAGIAYFRVAKQSKPNATGA